MSLLTPEALSGIITQAAPEASRLVTRQAIFFRRVREPAETAAQAALAAQVESQDQALQADKVETQSQALEARQEALLTPEVLRDSITALLMAAPLFLNRSLML